MTPTHHTRSVRSIKVHCPIDHETFRLIEAGDLSSIMEDSAFSAIMNVIGSDNPLGDFGIYKSVVELSAGWELFTPGDAAKPTLGRAGTPAVSPTAILTVYIPADAEDHAVSEAIAAILAAHPWEHRS